ncbi:MAG: hypothetical protein IPH88_17155 [Bacteroidales bacterium]|nr:hypothetical protein [Bacteroidales bacterium]
MNPIEQEAFDALNNREYEKATTLFFQLYHSDYEDKDRCLTHACISIWMGVQNCCHTAGSIFICALMGMNDSGYASELFITSLFRLKKISSKFITPISDEICETVEKTANILKHLVETKKSNYAMAWYANVLRGMANYSECNTFIVNSLSDTSLPEDVVKQLKGCRENISGYDNDSAELYQKKHSQIS